MENLNLSAMATILWILAISGVGMMPMRFHWRLGLPMLCLFPLVLVWLGSSMGLWWAVALLVGAVSIYRYPARHFALKLWTKLRGQADTEI